MRKLFTEVVIFRSLHRVAPLLSSRKKASLRHFILLYLYFIIFVCLRVILGESEVESGVVYDVRRYGLWVGVRLS